MAYTVIDRVYSIFIDVMTGVSSGSGSATFYNTDSHTSYIELTVTNGIQLFDMTAYNYVLVISKPNKQMYRNEYTTTDKAKLVIEMDSQMLASSGNNKGQLYIMKTVDNVDKVLTMVEFNYIVKEGSYNELAPESTNHDALYITLRNDVDTILKKIENGEIGGGSGGTGMTAAQKEQLATAYNHAMSDAVTTTDEVNSAVASYVEANKDALKGDKGDKGDKGENGAIGTNGKDGLTTAVSVNGNTYTHKNGTITLPNYPTVPTKTSQLTNDSNYLKPTDNINASSLNGKKLSNPMTKAEYEAIPEKDASTIYLVDDDSSVIGVPKYTASDANKILAVNASGNNIGWVNAPSSGSGSDSPTTGDVIVFSPSGYKFKIIVSDEGILSAEQILDYGKIVLNTSTLSVNEGDSATFTVTLDSAPSISQTVDISSNNMNVVVSPSTISFNTTNYNVSQTVNVSANKDDDALNDTAIIKLSTPNDTKTIDVTVIDNGGVEQDTYGNIVTNISDGKLVILEGINKIMKVYLDKAPSKNQTVAIAVDDSNVAYTNPTSLEFTPDNYNTAKDVYVVANHSELTTNLSAIITLSSPNVDNVIVNLDALNIDAVTPSETLLAMNDFSITTNELDQVTEDGYFVMTTDNDTAYRYIEIMMSNPEKYSVLKPNMVYSLVVEVAETAYTATKPYFFTAGSALSPYANTTTYPSFNGNCSIRVATVGQTEESITNLLKTHYIARVALGKEIGHIKFKMSVTTCDGQSV